MIIVDSQKNISMTRGDTFAKILSLKKDGEVYEPQDGDVIRFNMSKGYKGNHDYILLIQKVIPNDTLLWKLEPNDTSDIPYGRYNYDLEITYADGTVETFLNDRKFSLTKEVG